MDKLELDNRFTYHPPATPDAASIYQDVRDKAKTYARWLVKNTPESREQSLALTKLEEVVFWSNAAIARRS